MPGDAYTLIVIGAGVDAGVRATAVAANGGRLSTVSGAPPAMAAPVMPMPAPAATIRLPRACSHYLSPSTMSAKLMKARNIVSS
ncbi:hypothetical protein, partial [Burkholderia pseudomultivorans]|uniref:hypothetical protein n=1 Tax=Burkholderia pseudomultivorans TaxID=1207504 RepID=UPI00287025CB